MPKIVKFGFFPAKIVLPCMLIHHHRRSCEPSCADIIDIILFVQDFHSNGGGDGDLWRPRRRLRM